MIYLFLLLGIVLHWTDMIDSALKKPDFSWKTFWKLNFKKIIIQLAFAFIVGYNKDLLNSSAPEWIGTEINTFTAPFIGYLAGSIWQRILKKIGAKK